MVDDVILNLHVHAITIYVAVNPTIIRPHKKLIILCSGRRWIGQVAF